MIYYKDINIKDIVNTLSKPKFGKNTTIVDTFSDDIFTIDTEASSLFRHEDGSVEMYTDKESNEYYGLYKDVATKKERVDAINNYYSKLEKVGLLYKWMFGINQTVVYGDFLEDLVDFLEEFNNEYKYKKIVYCHNTSYDIHFLQNVIEFDDVFARQTHKPLYAFSSKYNIVIKDSLLLCNMSLEKAGENFNLKHQKKKGDLDYNVLRTPYTKLSDEELGYCEYDILTLYDLIEHFKNIYGKVKDIPLTQTGMIRKELKKHIQDYYNGNYFAYKNYLKKTTKLVDTFENYVDLVKIYSGGYVHSNPNLTNKTIKVGHGKESENTIYTTKITSHDFSSSYPYCLCCFKYPSSSFTETDVDFINYYEEDRDALIIDVDFYDISVKNNMAFISTSKCIDYMKNDFKTTREDNGRVAYSKHIHLLINEIDFKLIKENYNFKKMVVNSVKVASKQYLPKPIVDFVIKLYEGKTELKDVEEKEDIYKRMKQQLNGIYGMMVTKTIIDLIKFENGEWSKYELNENDIKNIINEMQDKNNEFLAYSWGVWCTSYARYNLSYLIKQIDENSIDWLNGDIIYSDTDSVKYMNNHDDIINNYNKKVDDIISKSAKHFNFNINRYYPTDINGKKHPLGYADFDGSYTEFRTLGAKKYIARYTKDNKLHMTLSGVKKDSVVYLNNNIENFKPSHVFAQNESGKLGHYYNDNQKPFTIDGVTYNYKHGVCLQPASYYLNLSLNYFTFLEDLLNDDVNILIEEEDVGCSLLKHL